VRTKDLRAQTRGYDGGQQVSRDFGAPAFAQKQRGPGLSPIVEGVGKLSGEKLEGLSVKSEFGLVNTLKALGGSVTGANVADTLLRRASCCGRFAQVFNRPRGATGHPRNW